MCNCAARAVDLAPFVLRVSLGLIFLLHGYQKLQTGVTGVGGFLAGLGFPAPEAFAILLIAAEIVGGILLILGLFTHWAAKLLAFVALVALLTVHVRNGFFLASNGYEYILLIFAASLSLMVTGPGKWSLDRLLWNRV